jgi:hypothetical protein
MMENEMQYKTTKKGYLRHRTGGHKSTQMEHRLVWEEHYGEIPEGMQIHHIDGDKTNNDMSNLMLLTPLEHKRIHEGCVLKDGVWLKPCACCGELKPITKEHWYFARGWVTGRLCKLCYIKKTCKQRKEREAKGWVRKEYRKENP